MKISTDYWPKPILLRGFDWSAVDSDTYDGPGCPVGHGPTESEAIADLLSQLWGVESDWWIPAVEEIPTIEGSAPWDFITTDGAKE